MSELNAIVHVQLRDQPIALVDAGAACSVQGRDAVEENVVKPRITAQVAKSVDVSDPLYCCHNAFPFHALSGENRWGGLENAMKEAVTDPVGHS